MILARHAESAWNRIYGRTRIDPGIPDPPLTRQGRAQALALAGALRGQGIARIVTSPYRRALETAVIVAERLGLEITVEALVRERNAFSCDQGSPPETLARDWPGLVFDHLAPDWWGAPVESEASVQARCAAFRRATDSLPERRQLLVISHWGFIRGMTGQELANAAHLRLP